MVRYLVVVLVLFTSRVNFFLKEPDKAHLYLFSIVTAFPVMRSTNRNNTCQYNYGIHYFSNQTYLAYYIAINTAKNMTIYIIILPVDLD